MNKAIICLLACLIVIVGCAGPSRTMPGQSKIVETSGDKPDWVKKGDVSWTEKQNIYVKAMVNRQTDYSLGEQVCKSEGIRQIMEQVKLRGRADFSNAVKGDNTEGAVLGRATESVIALTTDNLEVSGIVADEVYWDKYETYDGSGMTYSYNIQGLYHIPESKYQEAVRNAVMSAAEKAKAAKDKEAETLLNQAKDRLYKDDPSGK
jgi:hypothetical protein